MIVGYARVSTADQSLDRQLDLLASAGVDSRSVYKEKMTGTKRHRPELDRMISEHHGEEGEHQEPEGYLAEYGA